MRARSVLAASLWRKSACRVPTPTTGLGPCTLQRTAAICSPNCCPDSMIELSGLPCPCSILASFCRRRKTYPALCTYRYLCCRHVKGAKQCQGSTLNGSSTTRRSSLSLCVLAASRDICQSIVTSNIERDNTIFHALFLSYVYGCNRVFK